MTPVSLCQNNLVISSKFCTNFYSLKGSVKFLQKYLKHFLICPSLLHLLIKLHSPFYKKWPIFSFGFKKWHPFLYKYLRLWSNKSVLNWTFWQLLHWKLEPLDCNAVCSEVKPLDCLSVRQRKFCQKIKPNCMKICFPTFYRQYQQVLITN